MRNYNKQNDLGYRNVLIFPPKWKFKNLFSHVLLSPTVTLPRSLSRPLIWDDDGVTNGHVGKVELRDVSDGTGLSLFLRSSNYNCIC